MSSYTYNNMLGLWMDLVLVVLWESVSEKLWVILMDDMLVNMMEILMDSMMVM